MRISTDVRRARSWRVRDVVADFTLEDVWALPVRGGRSDFHLLVEMVTEFDPAEASSIPTRVLWKTRDRLGQWFGIGRIASPATESDATESVANRLPDDLRGTARDHRFLHVPFRSLYVTEDEFAGELSNATVHGVMHLGWAELGNGEYRAEMSVYVKPRGPLGRAYMAAIKPFRYLIVYPALERQLGREWKARGHSTGVR